MKSQRHFTDTGIVMKKIRLKEQHISVDIFSEEGGKLHLFAFGVRNITSRRLSHLETGNIIKFSYSHIESRFLLSETELVSAYSQIKSDPFKLQKLYEILQLLSKILPEQEPEQQVFKETLAMLKNLNNRADITANDVTDFASRILQQLGYIDEKTLQQPGFDPYLFIKQLT